MRRQLILCLTVMMLAACRADVQPGPTITAAPVDTPTFTVTPSPGNNGTALANARATFIATRGFQATRDIEALTATATRPATITPTTTLTPLPTSTFYPIPTPQPVIVDGGALPNGALDRIGIGQIHDVALSPDDSQIALATSSGIYIYNTDDLSLVWRRYLLEAPYSIDWSSDGTKLITGRSIFGPPMLRDAVTAERLGTLDGSWFEARFSPDGTMIAAEERPSFSIESDGSAIPTTNSIRIYDSNGQFLRRLDTETRDFYGQVFATFVWSPDSRYLVAALQGGTIGYLWDVATGQLLHVLEEGDVARDVDVIRFSPDGKLVGLLDFQEFVVSDVTTGEQQFILSSPVGMSDIAWSPNSQNIVSTGRRTIFWDGQTGDLQRQLDIYGAQTSWSPDGSKVAVNYVHEVRIIDPAGDTLATYIGSLDEDRQIVQSLWLPDSRHLLTFSGSWSDVPYGSVDVVLWDSASQTVVAGFDPEIDPEKVTWAADSLTLFIQDQDQSAFVWNAATHQVAPYREGPIIFSEAEAGSDYNSLWGDDITMSPNGLYHISIFSQGFCGDGPQGGGCFADNTTIQIHESGSDRVIWERYYLEDGISSVAWSADGSMLAMGFGMGYSQEFDHTILIVDPLTDQDLFHLVGHSQKVIWLAFSPQGDRIASASADGTVIIWDLTR